MVVNYQIESSPLSSIIANLNPFATLPTTSKGAGEIIHYTGDNTIRWNSQTTNPTTNPIWSNLSDGGGDFLADGSVPMTGNLNVGSNYLTYVDSIGFGAAPNLVTTDAGTFTFKAAATTILSFTKTLITFNQPLSMETNNITNVGAISFGATPVLTTTDAGTFTFKALTTTILSFTKTLITFAKELAMSGNKITGLGAHTANGDAVRYEHLAADDHTQYLLVAGSRAMTGALAMGTNNITNIGGMNFGAAPIIATTDAGEILFKALTTTIFGMTKTLNKSYVPLDMYNNKITNLSAGTANGNAIRYEQLIGQYLPLGGGTLSGNLLLGTNNITGVGALGFGAAPVITTTDAGTITFKALTTTILTLAKTLITATVSLVARDHGTAATDEVVNVCYGTSATPPTASTTTEGALYIQYTA